MTAMMTVGSVRGKVRLDIPVLVTQDGRCEGVSVVVACAVSRVAKSVGGQTRFVPALVDRVGCPQPAQKGLRAFQSRSALAWAKMAAGTS